MGDFRVALSKHTGALLRRTETIGGSREKATSGETSPANASILDSQAADFEKTKTWVLGLLVYVFRHCGPSQDSEDGWTWPPPACSSNSRAPLLGSKRKQENA